MRAVVCVVCTLSPSPTTTHATPLHHDHTQVADPKRSALRLEGMCGCPPPHDATSAFATPQCCWVDMVGYAQSYNYAVTFAGFIGLLLTLKFFKYFTVGACAVAGGRRR